MIQARAELVLDHPFFAALALRLELREDPHCATAWSDGRILGYNPAYIGAQSLEQIKGMQCHEVLHLACAHHLRRDGRAPNLWNRACDYAINPILLEAGIQLPAGFLDDPAHHGKSADAIYDALLKDMEERAGGQGAADGTSPSDEEADAGGGGKELGGQEQGGNPGQEEPSAPGRDQGGDGEAGADGDNTDPGRSGEVRDAPVPSLGAGDDQSGAEEEWRMHVAQAMRAAREAGNLPGSVERFFQEMLAPRLGWREILARFAAQCARNDFSWVRPNRRYLHAGLYLPGLDSLELSEVAVAVDVSGSVEQTQLDAFCAEISSILEEFDTELILLTCDAKVTSLERLTRQDMPLNLTAVGGGGTDFRPPFQALEQEGIRPSCLIYFTDMQCTRYPEDPGYPVLWLAAHDGPASPPFGEVVNMEVS
jgi:predicted metal-dependent peptidase